jgi:hypothetical protein
MTEDEARTAIMDAWRHFPKPEKSSDLRVTAFCYRMAAEYSFRCTGERYDVVRSWVAQWQRSERADPRSPLRRSRQRRDGP